MEVSPETDRAWLKPLRFRDHNQEKQFRAVGTQSPCSLCATSHLLVTLVHYSNPFFSLTPHFFSTRTELLLLSICLASSPLYLCCCTTGCALQNAPTKQQRLAVPRPAQLLRKKRACLEHKGKRLLAAAALPYRTRLPLQRTAECTTATRRAVGEPFRVYGGSGLLIDGAGHMLPNDGASAYPASEPASGHYKWQRNTPSRTWSGLT